MKFISACLALMLGGSALAQEVCDPVGVYDVMFHCEDGGNIVGPVPQFHEIFDRGAGFYNFYAQLASPHLVFNFTMSPIPGEVNKYQGAISWINYYPGPADSDPPAYAPAHIPPLISIQVQFDEDCNYWTEWMTQRPGFGRGGLSQDNIYTPPTHPCHTQGIRRGGTVPGSADPEPAPAPAMEAAASSDYQRIPKESKDGPPARRRNEEVKSKKTRRAMTKKSLSRSFMSKEESPEEKPVEKPLASSFDKPKGETDVDRRTQEYPFLANYDATIQCFVGDQQVASVEETHTFYTIPASEVGFFGLFRSRGDGYESIDVLSHDYYEQLEFHGGTQNVTGYNMVETDPAWWDENLIPLIKQEIKFEDDSYDRYEIIIIGQRPGPAIDGFDLGAFVCRGQGTREGMQPSVRGEGGCDPSGRYDVAAHCCTYDEDLGMREEDFRVESLGDGFYTVTQYQYGVFPDEVEGTKDLWISRSLVVEDPTNPGFYIGTTYYRNDYRSAEVSIIEYPVYVTMQFYFEDADGDGSCDTFDSNAQNYRPGPDAGPFGRNPEVMSFDSNNVVHYCQYEGETIHVGAVVDASCMDGTSGCTGICWEGQYDYVAMCIAGQSLYAPPNFVREVIAPNAQVLEGSCADHGFPISTACPDTFYGLNDVCLYSNDPTGEWLEARAPGFFNEEINPYVSDFEFPWGLYWRNDNPQCAYIPPGEPDTPTTCGIAGRWHCPGEVCVNGTQIVIDGSQPGAQTMLISDRGLNYYDIVVNDNPFGVTWSAIMYQKQWDKLVLEGAMWQTSNHVSTYDNPDHQLIEITLTPGVPGAECDSLYFILEAYTSVPREWESPFHICDMTCTRIRGFGPTLQSLESD